MTDNNKKAGAKPDNEVEQLPIASGNRDGSSFLCITTPNSMKFGELYEDKYGNDSRSIDAAGVWQITNKRYKGKGGEPLIFSDYKYVGKPLWLDSKIFAEDTQYIKLFFEDSSGKIRSTVIKSDAVVNQKNIHQGLVGLHNAGYISYDQTALAVYIKTCLESAAEGKGTAHKGWLQTGDKTYEYIYPEFKTDAAIEYVGGAKSIHFSKGGTLEKQVGFYRGVFEENSPVFFICGASLTGYFSRHVNVDYNPVFIIIGESGTGKSTTLEMAIAQRTYVDKIGSLNSTANNMVALLHQNKDSFACFDEVGEANKSFDAQQFVYAVANGRERGKMKLEANRSWTGTEQSRSHFTTLFTGELTMLKQSAVALGSEVRINEIYVDKDNELWTFTSPDGVNKNEIIEEYRRNLKENYGHIAPLVIEAIRKDVGRVKSLYDKWLRHLRKDQAAHANQRKVQPVAMAMVGCELLYDVVFNRASDAKLRDFQLQDVVERAMSMLKVIGDGETSASASTDDKFKSALVALPSVDADKFDYISHQNTQLGDAGHHSLYYGRIKRGFKEGELEIRFIREAFLKWAESGQIDPKRFLAWAVKSGYADSPNAQNKACRGSSPRCYVFKLDTKKIESESLPTLDDF